jgi:hypothetical protein
VYQINNTCLNTQRAKIIKSNYYPVVSTLKTKSTHTARGVASVTHLRTCVTLIQENKNSNMLKTVRKLKGMGEGDIARFRF